MGKEAFLMCAIVSTLIVKIPRTGIEPVRLAAGDFRTAITFVTIAVCGLEHAFAMALRLQAVAVCSLHLPFRAWLGVTFNGLHRI